MSKKSNSGSGVFMMEMIVAVFFFILCASICILVFVRSDNMSLLAKDMNLGVVAAESMAEIWKAEGTEGIELRLDGIAKEQEVAVYWSDKWEITTKENASYSGLLQWTTKDGLEEADIEINRTKDNKQLFILQVARFLPETE